MFQMPIAMLSFLTPVVSRPINVRVVVGVVRCHVYVYDLDSIVL